ncbi:MAG: TetR/AcrR family transcriptional regulator [Rhodoglobus sp.]
MDRARNKALLLAAASEAVRTQGLDVSMRAIARDAGLGIATAYRHFPAKADLLEAVLAERVSECVLILREALDEPDPWAALKTVIDRFAEVQITDPGLLPLLLDVSASGSAFAEARREHSVALEELFRNAAAHGVVSSEASVEDVRVGMMAMTAFAGASAERSASAIRTLQSLILRGIAPRPT